MIALAATIRIATADYGLWFDEIATMTFARQPIGRLWSGWMVRESNPPLFYTLMHGWRLAVGDADFTLRLLPIAIAIGGILCAGLLARRLGGRWAGWIAVGLLSISAIQIDYAQELRGYILGCSAGMAGLLALAVYLERPRASALVGYAAASLIALYSHSVMAVFVGLLAAMGCWFLRRDRRALVGFVAANLLVGLGWSWWATLLLAGKPVANIGWMQPPGVMGALHDIAIAYLPLHLASEGIGAVILLALLAAALAWIAATDRRPMPIVLAVLSLAMPLVLFIASRWQPMLLPRTVLFAAGPMIVLLALGVARLRTWPRAGAILFLTALSLVGVASWYPIHEPEPWRQALATIAARDPRARIVVVSDSMALAAAYYQPIAAPGVTIVALPREVGGYDGWAEGLYHGRRADVATLPSLLPAYALSRGDHEPSVALRRIARGRPLPYTIEGRQPRLSYWTQR